MHHGDKQPKGEMSTLMKELPENVKPFVQAILEKRDFPERLAKLSSVLRKINQKDPAVKIARYALSIAPDNAKVRRLAYWAIRKSVPLWHFQIVNDEERNRHYGEALKRFVTKDSRDHNLILENHPGAPSKTWSPVCHLFPEPVPVKKGDLFRISVEFDDEHLYIEPKGVAGKT
jgi:hypothetical protein